MGKCHNIEIKFVVSFAKDVSIFIIRHKFMEFDIVVDINENLKEWHLYIIDNIVMRI